MNQSRIPNIFCLTSRGGAPAPPPGSGGGRWGERTRDFEVFKKSSIQKIFFITPPPPPPLTRPFLDSYLEEEDPASSNV